MHSRGHTVRMLGAQHYKLNRSHALAILMGNGIGYLLRCAIEATHMRWPKNPKHL